MAIKDLAIAFNGSDNSRAALKFAVQMCREYDSALTGIYAHAPVQFTGDVINWMPDVVLDSLKRADAKVHLDIEKTFLDAVAALDFKGDADWLSEEGVAGDILARTARYFDILVIGQDSNPETNRRSLPAESLVTRAGRPIIVVPKGYQARPFKGEAVVAWDGSRPAARALSDAVQVLEARSLLDIVSVSADSADGAKTVPPPYRDVLRHLQHHGIDAKLNLLTANRDGVGPTIVAFCADKDADVLVMGAFGHARLREELFGGVTRHILRNTNIPVLLAH